MAIKAIVFDMDGTLLDSLSGLHHSTNAALTQLGYPPRSEEEVRSFVGNGVGKLIERALPGGRDNPDYEACLAAFKEDYKSAMFSGTAIYDGICPLLQTLSDKGYRLAVVSNKIDSAVKALSSHFFGDLFPVSIGEREGIARKPAPDSVWAALQELGVNRDEAIYVGDSEVDLETARNAGIPCLSVTWGNRSEEELRACGADTLCHTPQELLNALLS